MKYLPVLWLLFLSGMGYAQESLEELIKEGIQYHDAGEFEKAIKAYQQALTIDPDSPLAHYEIAISYFAAQNYPEALEHSDKVIAQGERKYLLPALVTKGSCLDNLGKSQEAIQVYEKALNDYGGHYLLYYNLGLTQFNVENLKAGEEAILNALKANINHSSSHLLLSYIQEQKEKKVPHLLASYYFLLLEPNSRRSPDAYAKLRKSLEGNIEKTGKKDVTININPSSLEDEAGFSAVEL
ncbi:MAG: tetratricopeptide repeat protein, partial [Bacteroidota bacterium]